LEEYWEGVNLETVNLEAVNLKAIILEAVLWERGATGAEILFIR